MAEVDERLIKGFGDSGGGFVLRKLGDRGGMRIIELDTPWGSTYSLGEYPNTEAARLMDEYEARMKGGYRPVINGDRAELLDPENMSHGEILKNYIRDAFDRRYNLLHDDNYDDVSSGMVNSITGFIEYMRENSKELRDFIEKLENGGE